MKKRCFCLFLVLVLCLSAVPAQVLAASTMTKVSVADTATSQEFTIYDRNGNPSTFSYAAPEGGATMLVFFSTVCPNSQTLFKRLNSTAWIKNPYVNIIAIESARRSSSALSDFIETYAPNTTDYIDFYYADDDLLWAYWFQVSDIWSTTYPVVFLISETGTIEYADKAMTIPDQIQESLRQMSPAFDSYVDPHPGEGFGADVAITGALFYDTTSQILEMVNQERAAVGLSPLILDEELTYLAMLRAIECSLYYSHMRPTEELYSSILQDSIPLGASAENIARGQRSPEAVMTAWMNSEGHRENILRENMTHLGVGAAYVNGQFFWVQLFHSAATATENYVRTNNSVFLATIETAKEHLKPVLSKTKVDFVLEAGKTVSQRVTVPYTYWDSTVECPLLPILIDLKNPQNEVPVLDKTGNTIATICAAMDGSSDLIVTAAAPGTATVALPIYQGEDNPMVLEINVKPGSGNADRIYGANRFETAFAVADQLKKNLGVDKFDTIIVASGGDFADALSGSYLSAVKNAPILLGYKKGEYNAQAAAYIRDNLAPGGTVYILGGYNAIPESMEGELSGLNVIRLAGENRFETNLQVLMEAGVKPGQEILVATGTDFADCLSGSATGRPILLVHKKLLDSQKQYLRTLSNNFCIVGGTNAVTTDIEKAISLYGNVTRLAGANRLETSVLVAQRYFRNLDSAVLAYGWNYPDGLCGGPLAYSMGAPLILTHSKAKYYALAADYTAASGITSGIVLGGEGLISADAVEAIFAN